MSITDGFGPAILNKTLQMSDFHNALISDGMTVKVAKSTFPDTCIFPKISLAFLMLSVNSDDIANSTCIQTRIKEFIDHHEQSIVIILVKQLDGVIIHFVGQLQLEFHPKETNIIFVLNCLEAAKVIRHLTTMTHPHTKQLSQEKIEFILSNYNNDENILLNATKCISGDNSSLLLETYGSISAMANAGVISEFLEKNFDVEE